MKNGFLIINKPKGYTSRDVVNEVSKKLGIKHIGHTGTLDPIATGILILGINNGCKVIELITNEDNEYIAEVIVGVETDTLDSTGNILNTYNIENLTKKEVTLALNSFIGKYNQEVPKYSAIHVNGKRLYEYARNDIDIELPKREVEIKKIKLLSLNKDTDNRYHFTFSTLVSKGTYIRSLIRDIGIKLNIPCTMNNLIRTKQGNISIEKSINLEEISESTKLIPITDILNNYPKLIVSKDLENKVKNGAILDLEINNYLLILNDKEELLAIYKPYAKDLKKCKPYKVFGGN